MELQEYTNVERTTNILWSLVTQQKEQSTLDQSSPREGSHWKKMETGPPQRERADSPKPWASVWEGSGEPAMWSDSQLLHCSRPIISYVLRSDKPHCLFLPLSRSRLSNSVDSRFLAACFMAMVSGSQWFSFNYHLTSDYFEANSSHWNIPSALLYISKDTNSWKHNHRDVTKASLQSLTGFCTVCCEGFCVRAGVNDF